MDSLIIFQMAFVAAGTIVADLISQEVKKQALQSGINIVKGVRHTACSAIPVNRPFLRAAIGCGTKTSSRSFGGSAAKKRKQAKASKSKKVSKRKPPKSKRKKTKKSRRLTDRELLRLIENA